MIVRSAGFLLVHPLVSLWAWARRHPRWATVLVVVATLYVTGWIVGAPHAFAEDSAGSDIKGDDLLSSMGIPASHYHALFVNRGDLWTTGQMFWSNLADYAWGFHYDVVVTAIDTFVWLMKFEWLDLIAIPMAGISRMVSDILGQLGVLNFALFASGVVAAFALVFMKISRAVIEVVLATIIAVAATGVLANPVVWLTADDGPIDKAQMYGSQLSAALLVGEGKISELEATGEDIIGAAMEAKLVDLFIATPAEEISFGHRITGDCKTTMEAAILAVDPVKQGDNSVRDAVGGCDARAKDWAANTGPIHYFNASNYSMSSISLLIVSYLISGVLIMAIFATLFSAMQITWRSVLSVFPFTNRGKLLASIALTASGVLFVVTMQAVLAGYWALLDTTIGMLAEMGFPITEQLRWLTFFEVALVILLIVIFINHRRIGKILAERSDKKLQALKMSGVGLAVGSLPMANELKTYAMHRLAARHPAEQPDVAPGNEIGPVTVNNFHVVNRARAGSRRRPVHDGEYSVMDTSTAGGPDGGGSRGGAAGSAAAVGGKAAKVAVTAGRYAKALSAGPAGVATELAKDGASAAASAVAKRRISVDRNGVGHVASGLSGSRPGQSAAIGGGMGLSVRPVSNSAGPTHTVGRRVVIGNDGVGRIVHETSSIASQAASRTAAVARAVKPIRELT